MKSTPITITTMPRARHQEHQPGTCRNPECVREKRKRGQTISRLYARLRAALVNADEAFVHEVPIGARNERDGDKITEMIEKIQEEFRDGDAPGAQQLPDHSCMICWASFDDKDHFPAVMNCGHVLCFACMAKLTSFKCPKCRQVIKSFIRLYI